HGLFRLLPVEMTMLNDLPVLLNPPRARRSNPPDPRLMLYFLDDNAWIEPGRIWIRGRARAEIVVRSVERMGAFRVAMRSRVPNVVTVSAGRGRERVTLSPGERVVVHVRANDAYSRNARACLLSIEAADGVVPQLVDPDSSDGRFLGVEVEITGVPAG
ncbi:MAG TPA: hypothetical protein VIL25_06150, partial [Vicinamibacterales bacterium]